MADVSWSDAASDQLDQIIAYIDVFDPGAALRIGDRLIAAADSLCDFPNRGRPGAHATRELATVPPYVLQYEVVDDVVTILRVRHGARRPID